MTLSTIVAINVDLRTGPLGLPARLGEEIAGASVLRRTIERATRIHEAESVHLLCPADQRPAVADHLTGLNVEIETHVAPPPPYVELVRASRVWGLDGWRGGIGSLCAFDEDFHATVVAALLQKIKADAVLSVPAAAPLLDPALLDEMIRYHREHIDTAQMTIVQAPPGLGGVILSAEILNQLVPTGMPPGALLVYQPDSAAADLTGREGCYRPATEIVHASGRLIADTQRSIERIQRAFDAGGADWSAQEICRWLLREEASRVESVPTEIEIELTTEDQFDENDLTVPRGKHVPNRGSIDIAAIKKIAATIGDMDDVRIVLGGFGEPTLHPRFAEICNIFRSAGALAICVRTNGLAIPQQVEDAFFQTPIDVVEITLDAATPETYQRVHGRDGYATVVATIERLMHRRRAESSVRPLLVPSLVKCAETMDDLEPFVDRWQRALGMYAVRGLSDYGGQWRPDYATRFSLAPAPRGRCRRTLTRTAILADGSVTSCDQDCAGQQILGDLNDASFESLWKCETLRQIRANEIDALPLCNKCDQWHRP